MMATTPSDVSRTSPELPNTLASVGSAVSALTSGGVHAAHSMCRACSDTTPHRRTHHVGSRGTAHVSGSLYVHSQHPLRYPLLLASRPLTTPSHVHIQHLLSVGPAFTGAHRAREAVATTVRQPAPRRRRHRRGRLWIRNTTARDCGRATWQSFPHLTSELSRSAESFHHTATPCSTAFASNTLLRTPRLHPSFAPLLPHPFCAPLLHVSGYSPPSFRQVPQGLAGGVTEGRASPTAASAASAGSPSSGAESHWGLTPSGEGGDLFAGAFRQHTTMEVGRAPPSMSPPQPSGRFANLMGPHLPGSEPVRPHPCLRGLS